MSAIGPASRRYQAPVEAMESFYSTLLIERVNRTRYRTRDRARVYIFDSRRSCLSEPA